MKPATTIKKTSVKKKADPKSFPVVAIGASSGGLEAMSLLLKNLEADTGMAFIFVQHLSPDHKSFLTSILGRVTKMKVQEIEDMEKIEPDNVYVIPYNKEIEVIDGHIQLLPRQENKPTNLSIDILFSSLAATHKENTIGVILSGNASDGTLGLKAIKDAGGITFAQDDSATASSMPKSAIASGVVDFILSPLEIALELGRIGKNGYPTEIFAGNSSVTVIEDTDPEMRTVFEVLYKETGIDFSHYKTASVKRRLNHRMAQSGVKSIKEYVKYLQKNHAEIDILNKALLINVTSFFRDKEAFRYLKTTLLPRLLKSKTPSETVRIWVPGCSTGEEAYSIAMLITELQEKKSKKIPVQIFGTDLSEFAIREARFGEFPQASMKTISQTRLDRFFTKKGDLYCAVKELRDMCVFAPHNILRDPPFSRMDFISCCNLLIYFDAAAQKKALATFHFALKDKGELLLGKSETIGASSQIFTQTDAKIKIYSRKMNTGKRKVPDLMPRLTGTTVYEKNIKPLAKKSNLAGFPELDIAIDSVLLENYMPACAIINKEMEIFQFRGSTSLYLTHSSGKASLNILKMTRPECALELRNAINTAIKTKHTVLKSGIEIKNGAVYQMMSLEVSPLKIEWDEPLLLVVFTLQQEIEKPLESDKSRKNISTEKDRTIKKLTEELSGIRAEMNAIIESQETIYEELQAANEEIVSSNEEFQVLNEELETSKEEIEATNEELIATNQEMQIRNDLLLESYNYSEAISDTIHEPMMILDNKLHIKSANKSFYKKFQVNSQNTEGIGFFALENKQWNIPVLRGLLEDMLSKNIDFENFEVTHNFPGIGLKTMLLNAHLIIQKTHREQLILLAFEDITERNQHYTSEKELLKKDIVTHEAEKISLEHDINLRNKELLQKNRELENANRDLTSFTYVSSHDLQEPLRKIQNFVALLLSQEKECLSKDGKTYLVRVDETARRMRALLDDLLVYSGSKNTEPKFEKTDLNAIVDIVLKDFEEIIKEKTVKIQVQKLGEARIIRLQFSQVLQNLISNSLKFSKPGIEPLIKIKSEKQPGRKLKIEALNQTTDYVHITYTDNGIGFDALYKDRIFEVFQRLHSKEEYKGTGMGLAICKRIIENHDGLITATGMPNKGARFDIYLPAA